METHRIVMTSTFYPPFHFGGDATHVSYLSGELAKRGHEVHVVFSLDAYALKSREKKEVPKDESVHIHAVKSGLGRLSPVLAFMTGRNRAAERALASVCHEVRPDWVHHHNISLLGAEVLNIAQCPQLYTAHDYWLICQRSDLTRQGSACAAPGCLSCSVQSLRPYQYWRGGHLTPNLDRISAIISPSRFMARTLEERLGRTSTVIPTFCPRGKRIDTEKIKDHFVFVSVLEEHKGLRPLLDAFLSGKVESELHVMGTGSMAAEIRQAEQLSKGRIRYLGFVPREVLMSEVGSALALVMPSIWNENNPAVCIEAMSLAVPLIVSDRGGLPELIEEGDCGLICPPEVGPLTESLQSLMLNEPRRLSMAENALQTYERYHTPEAYLASYLGLAERVLKDRV